MDSNFGIYDVLISETWKPWIPSLKPEWWPTELPYRSTRKSDVASLDKILHSFLKFRATTSMVSLLLDGSPRRKRRLCFGWRIESPLDTKG